MADCDAVDFLKAWNLEQYIDIFRGKYLLFYYLIPILSRYYSNSNSIDHKYYIIILYL